MSPHHQLTNTQNEDLTSHQVVSERHSHDQRLHSPAVALHPEQSTMLSQVITSLNNAQRACEAELRALGKEGEDCPCEDTSPELYAELQRRLLSIEQIVYAYGCSSRYNRREVREYIRRSCSDPESLVAVHTDQDQILVFLPYLPKRNRAKHAPVHEMLAAEIQVHKFPKWSGWSATFTHLYPATTRHIPKDVDNYDYKKTIDLLAYALGTSDNALNYSMSMQTIFSDILPPGVYIHLQPKNPEINAISALDPFLELHKKR